MAFEIKELHCILGVFIWCSTW